MKSPLLTIFALVSGLVMAGCSQRDPVDASARTAAAEATQQKTEALLPILGEIDKLHEQCPQTMSGLQEGVPGCEEKLKKMIEATRMGWCLGESRMVYGREQHWQRCEDPSKVVAEARAPEPTKRQWFSHNINHSQCIEGNSPASIIRDEQGQGRNVKVEDLADGVVEVQVDTGRVYEIYRFYRTLGACVASLPRSHPIAGKYE